MVDSEYHCSCPKFVPLGIRAVTADLCENKCPYVDCEPPADAPPPDQLPNLVRSAINYTRAWVEHVAAEAPIVSDEERERRLTICRGGKITLPVVGDMLLPKCERYNAETDRCHHLQCGCYMAEKTWWGEQQCPNDPPKWLRAA